MVFSNAEIDSSVSQFPFSLAVLISYAYLLDSER